ncbi:MAG: SDH family Clp fold serine proteinase [bacterium]
MPDNSNNNERLKLITEIEKQTNSNLICLVYNTTPTRFRTQLASDLLSPLNSLLKSIPKSFKKENVFLLLHSTGGTLDVITSFVYLVRMHFKLFNVVIPEIAHSAATILSLGADKIYMSYYSSLSPFDPQVTIRTQAGNIAASLEAIEGYYSIMKDMFNDDTAKIQAFNLLANRFPPEVLGEVERVKQQVKMIASKMLKYQEFKDDRIESIVNRFQKEFFSHNYRIHFDEAKDLGLNVYLMNEELENLSLQLLSLYTQSFGGKSDLEIEIPEGENYSEIILNRSYLECQYSSFSYKTKYRVLKEKRVELEELGWLQN